MSSGHHHKGHKFSARLETEFKRLIQDPRIQAYLNRPYHVDIQHKIPLTGGSSQDGSIYYIDPDVPADLRTFVLAHERFEKAFRDILGMHYSRAHELATQGEKLLVEAAGHDWEQYKSQVASPVRVNEKRGPEPLPPNFDLGPMRESGLQRLVAQ